MKTQEFFWPTAHQASSLLAGQIHVWAWELDLPPKQADWEVLSEEESVRARRFIAPRHRDRYVRAHSAMRVLLGSYSAIHPAEIDFATNAYGKPQIAVEKRTECISFNLSHSEGMAVLAVSREHELGIDVEIVRPIDQEVAEGHFSQRELSTLRTLPPERWLEGFYRCWTSKEALLKGEGLGMNLPLDAFDVEVNPQLPPALLGVRAEAPMAYAWRMVELKPTRDAIGTLAIQGGAKAVLEYFSFNG